MEEVRAQLVLAVNVNWRWSCFICNGGWNSQKEERKGKSLPVERLRQLDHEVETAAGRSLSQKKLSNPWLQGSLWPDNKTLSTFPSLSFLLRVYLPGSIRLPSDSIPFERIQEQLQDSLCAFKGCGRGYHFLSCELQEKESYALGCRSQLQESTIQEWINFQLPYES